MIRLSALQILSSTFNMASTCVHQCSKHYHKSYIQYPTTSHITIYLGTVSNILNHTMSSSINNNRQKHFETTSCTDHYWQHLHQLQCHPWTPDMSWQSPSTVGVQFTQHQYILLQMRWGRFPKPHRTKLSKVYNYAGSNFHEARMRNMLVKFADNFQEINDCLEKNKELMKCRAYI